MDVTATAEHVDVRQVPERFVQPSPVPLKDVVATTEQIEALDDVRDTTTVMKHKTYLITLLVNMQKRPLPIFNFFPKVGLLGIVTVGSVTMAIQKN